MKYIEVLQPLFQEGLTFVLDAIVVVVSVMIRDIAQDRNAKRGKRNLLDDSLESSSNFIILFYLWYITALNCRDQFFFLVLDYVLVHFCIGFHDATQEKENAGKIKPLWRALSVLSVVLAIIYIVVRRRLSY